jgi:hypothetical protein
MKNLVRVLGISMMFIWVLLLGCTPSVDPGKDSDTTEQPGEIIGKALFSNADDHADITINLEKTDGFISKSVSLSQKAGRAVYSNGETVTSTAADGSYRFTGVSPGTYTVYASSRDSRERAVTTNVTVLAAQAVTVADLNLTAVGSIKGKIILDGTATGNLGFLVFVASTSYMAMTGEDGSFEISDVPVNANPGYQVYIMKGNYTGLWKETVVVSAGAASELGTKTLTTADLAPSGGNGGGDELDGFKQAAYELYNERYNSLEWYDIYAAALKLIPGLNSDPSKWTDAQWETLLAESGENDGGGGDELDDIKQAVYELYDDRQNSPEWYDNYAAALELIPGLNSDPRKWTDVQWKTLYAEFGSGGGGGGDIGGGNGNSNGGVVVPEDWKGQMLYMYDQMLPMQWTTQLGYWRMVPGLGNLADDPYYWSDQEWLMLYEAAH